MKRTTLRNTLLAAGLAGTALFGVTAPVSAQMGGWGMGPGMMHGPGYEQRQERAAPPDAERGPSRGYGYGYGYGPGYGMGPGMMGGYGPGYGMGPGMMGGYGPGYGMGPGMMGHMMGGYGMGPGMMGGYGHGMGPGMMGGYGTPYYADLSAEQRKKLDAIHEELARKQWDIGGKMHEEAVKLHELTAADKRDRAAIVAQYKKLQDLRLQRFQARLEAQDKLDGVLTKEQKERARRFGSW